jgi:formylmethanofuran dehydrogenase subunit D
MAKDDKGGFEVKAIMISGRTLAQGAACESKMSPEFFRATSVCSVSEEDYESIGLSNGKNVLISNDFGRATLTANKDPGLPKGLVFIPMGPWANALIGPETGGCGTPHFKGVEVNIEATDAPVLEIRELFRDIGRAKA